MKPFTAMFLACGLVLSCGPAPYEDVPVTCVSPYGTILHVLPGAEALGDCAVFHAQEELAVVNILRYMGSKEARELLRALSGGTHVLVYPIGHVETVGGQRVNGWADCMGSVFIQQRDVPDEANWKKAALTHEYVHLAQNCNAESPKPDYAKGDYERDPQHANWWTSGAMLAICHADDDALSCTP